MPSDGAVKRVGRMYQLLYGRKATVEELALAQEFLAGTEVTSGTWERYAQALLLANEFVFID